MKHKPALAIVMFISAANLVVWTLMNLPASAVPWHGTIRGVSFSPFQRHQDPLARQLPSVEEIDRDLELLADKVENIRTYTTEDGIDVVPRLAQKYGLKVTCGAWLDGRLERNRREISSLINNVWRNGNINRVIVGNEAIMRGDLTVEEVTAYLRLVRSRVDIPVSTAEPWNVWLENPELVDEVDYIAVHLLPYWDKAPIDDAVDFVMYRYRELQETFPGKPILIAEVGWPTNGNRRGAAEPSRINAAKFVRTFLNKAEAENLEYFVMEAFDQPWKQAFEGRVGAYWGLFDADRQPKFSLTDEVTENATWMIQALVATLLALLPTIIFALRFSNLRLTGLAFYALLIQASASLIVWLAFAPTTVYLSTLGVVTISVLLAAQLGLVIEALIRGFEVTEVLWTRGWQRAFAPLSPGHRRNFPKVSLHVPCHNEPPELVMETLNRLALLDYPDFEVLVIDNNTRDPGTWRPLESHCASLGDRFRFFHLDDWPGYKAGALNFALTKTDPDAQVIGVVDSDYLVERDWLRSLMPYFDDPAVGFVQAPQDHRGWEGDRFKEMCNWEYAGFFNIGMVHRNERNAIIQHGTMTLIDKSALKQVGGWSEWCICEDAELGLRLLHAGFHSVYVNHVFGRGVAPDSVAAYKGQRFRWAYGAVQILKRHWHWLLSGNGNALTGGQRFHFVAGWFPWFADALHLMFTSGALLWSVGLVLLPRYCEFPLAAFLAPVLGMFLFKIVYSFVLYRVKVPCTLRQCLGAAVASVGLTHTIAKAVLAGIFSRGMPFFRTPKCEDRPALIRNLVMVREEALILIALWLAALTTVVTYGTDVMEALIWALILGIQSIPYGAAVSHAAVNTLLPDPQQIHEQEDTSLGVSLIDSPRKM